jgi:hypothetical protein
MLSTCVHMLFCLHAECTQCSADSQPFVRVLGSALFQSSYSNVSSPSRLRSRFGRSELRAVAHMPGCVRKEKKAPTLGDMPGCVCKEKESTRAGREHVAVAGGAMLGCPMWGCLGSMLTHVRPSLGHVWAVLKPSWIMWVCLGTI